MSPSTTSGSVPLDGLGVLSLSKGETAAQALPAGPGAP
jgi:hypothetical protein